MTGARSFDRWDGHGINRVRGEDLPLPMRIVALAHLADVFFTALGPAAALDAVGARAGRALDPDGVEALLALERDVARELGISEKTVGHHIEHIYDKLGVSTRAAAVMEAVTHGLL